MDPNPPSTGSASKKFQTRRGVGRKTAAEREQYALEEATRQQQRQAENAARNASTAAAAQSSLRGRGSTRGRGGPTAVVSNATERVRSEGGGVFGATTGGPGGTSLVKGRKPSQASGGNVEVIGAETSGESTGQEKNELRDEVVDITGPEKKGVAATKKKATTNSQGGKVEDAIEIDSDEGRDEWETRDIEKIWVSSDEDGDEAEHDEQGPIQRKGKQRIRSAVGGGMGLRPVRAARMPRESEREVKAGEGDEMDIDEQFKSDMPSSPELKKSGRKKLPKAKDSKVAIETLEEKAERLRYNEDVRKIREEFVGLPPRSVPTSATTMIDGDVMALDEVKDDARDGKIYLFQFPPLTPFLVDEAAHFEVSEALEDPENAAPEPIKKEKKEEVKKEDETDDAKAALKTKVPGALTSASMRLPGGLVGKLNIHKSGKVSLDWGGTDLEVRYGSEVDFLQDAVLVGGEDSRMTWALGQVEKKLVVIPDWQKLYD